MPHVAVGDIPVSRSRLSPGEQGVDETVDTMMEMAKGEYGARSAKIRALAVNIINDAGVGDKDYWGMIKAIHNWVRDEIRYVKDPVGQETLSYPEETAFNSKAGDCDDKTILEIAILGSVGIRAWPVVIGVRPGHYSHVYLDIEVPQGGRPGTKAGQVVHADPIMREWELGEEAPAHKITQKKTYEHLAGLPGLSGIDPMSLGAYASAPSYLDERNVPSVRRAMRAPLVDTASRGEILNAPKVEERNTTELDDMFQTVPALALHEAPWERLGPEGPVTGAEAAGSVRLLPARKMEVAVAARRSFAPVYRPVSDFQKLPGEAAAGVMVSNADAAADELFGIGTYIDSIMGDLLAGDAPQKVAAVIGTVIANRAAATARGFLPGMGDIDDCDRGVAKALRLVAAQPQPIRAAAARILRDVDARAPQAIRHTLDRQLAAVANSGLAGVSPAMRAQIKKLQKKAKKASGKWRKRIKNELRSLQAQTVAYRGTASKLFPAPAAAAVAQALRNNAAAGTAPAAQDVSLQMGATSGDFAPYTISVSGLAVYSGRMPAAWVSSSTSMFPAWAAEQRSKIEPVDAGSATSATSTVTDTIPATDPTYGGGYAGQAPAQQDYYGGGQGAPYSAPPVDSFGPSDMGPAQQSQSFTREVQASGDRAPTSWEDEAAEGAMPSSPDVVDDDVQAKPLPRSRRTRAVAEAAPAEDEGEGWTYEVEAEEAEAPESLDDRGTRADKDVAGLGNFNPGMNLATLAVAGVALYLLARK